jgi:hypothetical protein
MNAHLCKSILNSTYMLVTVYIGEGAIISKLSSVRIRLGNRLIKFVSSSVHANMYYTSHVHLLHKSQLLNVIYRLKLWIWDISSTDHQCQQLSISCTMHKKYFAAFLALCL